MGVDAAFSTFPGVNRTLAVADGAGLWLSAGAAPARLDRVSAPFSFPGDAPCHARLVDGAILNLNVMTRRGRFRHAVVRRDLAGAEVAAFEAIGAIICVRGSVTVGGQTMQPFDAALFRHPTSVLLEPADRTGTTVLAIEITPGGP